MSVLALYKINNIFIGSVPEKEIARVNGRERKRKNRLKTTKQCEIFLLLRIRFL